MKQFKIRLDSDWFKNNDILENEGVEVRVISTPKKHYAKWYWRVLNILTFKVFFNVKYTYTVEIIKNKLI